MNGESSMVACNGCRLLGEREREEIDNRLEVVISSGIEEENESATLKSEPSPQERSTLQLAT